eukprot:scaffold69816_cov72-Phaeocystis_antarctica.AAC.1
MAAVAGATARERHEAQAQAHVVPAQARCPLLSWEVCGLALGHDVHRGRQGESTWGAAVGAPW